MVAEDHHKCFSAAMWDRLEVAAPGDCISAIKPKMVFRPTVLPAISFILGRTGGEDIDGGQVSAVTIRAHRDVLLPHLQLCSGRFCRGTASIVNVVWCFSASAESLVTQSIGATIRTESGVQPICATEVAVPVVRVLLGVRRIQFQLRLLIRRTVSKSHLLQFRERLHLLSASREFLYVLL